MLNSPFSPWPSFTEEEAGEVKNIVLSNKVNYWTGSECRSFEQEFAKWASCEYAVALMNGTVALDLALHALEIQPGDEVIVTPRTFIASVSCVVNAGATPIFADIDLNTGNISAETIQRVLTAKTKAVICVHLGGFPCQMDPILDLATKHGFYVVEDCAQAHGAKYKGKSVGSIGHIGAWSFCQDKIMTTGGEGGMVTTNDQKLWRKMWAFKDHGKSFNAVYEREHPPGFRWVHENFGTNWRMLEIQAAIGRIQLNKMELWHSKRINNALFIWNVAKCLPGLRVPLIEDEYEHAAYKCYIYVIESELLHGWSRDRILHEIQERGVPCAQGSCSEVYLEKAFDETGWRPSSRLMNAKRLGETSLSFYVHPTLNESEIKLTCQVLSEVMHLACGK
jgi:dTDP-4-amino-4,6-dideoxygalactose transaminase